MIKIKVFFLRIGYFIAKFWWYFARPKKMASKAVVTNGGKVLLVRHTYGAGRWSFPGGGIEKDEDPTIAAKRELMEELKIFPVKIVETGKVPFENDFKSGIIYCFWAEVEDKNFTINPIEISEAKWFPKDEVIDKFGPNGRRIYDSYLSYVAKY